VSGSDPGEYGTYFDLNHDRDLDLNLDLSDARSPFAKSSLYLSLYVCFCGVL